MDEHRDWLRFGDGATRILHPDTAESVLRQLYAEDKARFGRFVAIALTGVPPRGGARKGEEA